MSAVRPPEYTTQTRFEASLTFLGVLTHTPKQMYLDQSDLALFQGKALTRIVHE